MARKLRIGIVGAGGIARGVHIPGYLKQDARVEIVAVSDVDAGRAEQTAAEFGIEHWYGDYHEMFRQARLDAVSICTPNKFHHPAALAALEAGCHVLCEKPPAMTVEQARAMEAASVQQSKHLVYGFHYRHTHQVETLKRFVEAGELGDIYAATVHAVRRRGIPGWGVFTNRELQGGGPLVDIGVHMIDTAMHLMGFPKPVEVSAATYQKLGTRPGVGLMGAWDWAHFSIEDMARGFVRFDNGASLVVETAFAANVAKEENMNVSLLGDGGGADLFPLRIYQEKHGSLIDVSPVYLPEDGAHEREIGRFVDLCLGVAPVAELQLCSATEGVAVQVLLDGFYRSAAAQAAVRL